WVVMAARAARALLAGRFTDGARLARDARAILSESEPTSFAEQVFAVQALIIDTELDRIADSEAGVRFLAERLPHVAGWRCSLAALHADLGRDAEARALLDQLAARDFADLPRDSGYAGAIVSLARAAIALGDAPRARLLYDLLSPFAERAVVVGFGIGCHGAAARYLAGLALLLGRPDDAAAPFDQALGPNPRTGARPYRARHQREYADFLVARGRPGDTARAEQLTAEAGRTAAELGMVRLGRLLSSPEPTGPRPEPEAATAVFRRAGDWWWVGFAGETFRVKDTKGARYLVALLRHPGQDLHVMMLAAEHAPGQQQPAARRGRYPARR